jgi:hypothetical protein
MGAAVTLKILPGTMEEARLVETDRSRSAAWMVARKFGSPIGPLHPALAVHRNHRLLHAIQQGFQLVATGLQGFEIFLQLFCGNVQRMRYGADFIGGTLVQPCRKVTLRDLRGETHDAPQARADRARIERSHHHRHQESQQRAEQQLVADSPPRLLDDFERIGQPYGATAYRRGHI